VDANGKAGVPLPEQRRRKILELIQEEGSAKVVVLRNLFSVTDPAIRQDLDKLEEDGHVVRHHGGALKIYGRHTNLQGIQGDFG
jgi:DeoR/GlpR family transcriptional regulator of sugar metabolism